MHAARHSSTARGSSRRRTVLLAGSVVAVAATTAVLLAGRGVATTDAAPRCAPGEGPLLVRAAPEIAPVVADVVRIAAGSAGARGCPAPRVVADDPAAVADALAAGRGGRPDVWIPDSSLWTRRAGRPGAHLPEGVSVARSPVVVAVPDAVASRVARKGGPLDAGDLVPRREGEPAQARWALGDAARSATSVAALLALQEVTAARHQGDALTATVLRAARRDLPPDVDAQLTMAAGSALAVPASEQAVEAYRRAYPSAPALVTAALPANGYSLDYPLVVLADRPARRARADALLRQLRGDLGRRLLQAAGFRDPDGLAAAGTTPADTGRVLRASAAAVAARALRSVVSGSRLLAVVDVSGSMATPVPGARGATRLDLALQASVAGLSLYPDDTQVGLWTFSTGLTPTTDYAELVPIGTLGRRGDGSSGRERVARALSTVSVKRHGDTGLYDTVLAAVREVRHGWDPTRVNSVVVITDGADDDPGGIGLPRLLRTLRREADPSRPVPVFAIAYGPSGDRRSLAAIGAATGGRTYVARDPRAIDSVLLDAIGRRAR